jgi:hypothetical protein
MYYVSRLSALLAIATLICAAWFSIRLARADADFRELSPESVARAVRRMPGNTDYEMLHALQLDYAGMDSTATLERVVTLNPMGSAARIRLGLAAEIRRDYATAERWLTDAARVDRQFEPRWTLANYYFRRQSAGPFWKWIRAALEVSYGDRRPAFELCWRMSTDGREILRRAIPERREELAAYLAYLLETRRPAEVSPVAMKLAAVHDPADRALLLESCDALLDAHDGAAAETLWIAMGYAAPSGIFNGNFEHPLIGRGFDWRAPEMTGVAHVSLETPPAHRITLSGQQPESCDLLRQLTLLKPGVKYTLEWESRTSGLRGVTGLEWTSGGQRAALAASDEWLKGDLAFTAPSGIGAVTLVYRRPAGEARGEGAVELRNVRLVTK